MDAGIVGRVHSGLHGYAWCGTVIKDEVAFNWSWFSWVGLVWSGLPRTNKEDERAFCSQKFVKSFPKSFCFWFFQVVEISLCLQVDLFANFNLVEKVWLDSVALVVVDCKIEKILHIGFRINRMVSIFTQHFHAGLERSIFIVIFTHFWELKRNFYSLSLAFTIGMIYLVCNSFYNTNFLGVALTIFHNEMSTEYKFKYISLLKETLQRKEHKRKARFCSDFLLFSLFSESEMALNGGCYLDLEQLDNISSEWELNPETMRVRVKAPKTKEESYLGTARKTRPFPKSFFYHQKTFTRLKSSSRRFFFILTTFSKLEIFLTKLISEVSKYGILAEKTTCSLLEWPSYIFLGMLRTLALFRNKKKVVA